MNKKLLLISTLSLSLIACTEQSNPSSQERAALYASRVKHEIHNQYLNCYPLSSDNKKQCVKKLSEQYLKKHLSDSKYVKSFQYEAEKLGFRNFLKTQGLPCESINDGPEFDYDKSAYLVKCTNAKNYYMQFDYQQKTWIIVD